MFFKLILLFFPLCAFCEADRCLIITIPKSGTHLIRKMIQLLGEKDPGYRDPRNFRTWHFYLRKNSDTRTIEEFYQTRSKKVILIRDLRDVVVSWVHYFDKDFYVRFFPEIDPLNAPYLSLATVQEKISYCLTPGTEMYDILLNNAILAAEASTHPEILCIRFEDLVGDFGGGSCEAQKLAIQSFTQFVGKPISNQAIERIQRQLFGGTNTFRKGKIGSWKQEFGEEQMRLFNASLGAYNQILGYQ